MKIYLASTAIGNEGPQKYGMIEIKNRLLSFYCIKFSKFENHLVFTKIKQRNENK